jgi:hypothetical protein
MIPEWHPFMLERSFEIVPEEFLFVNQVTKSDTIHEREEKLL